MVRGDIFYLNINDWQKYLLDLVSRFHVLAPREGLYEMEYHPVANEETARIIFPGARLTTPLKSFLYPAKESVTIDPTFEQKQAVLFGVKACDLKAIATLDHIFLDPDFVDPFYKTRRDNILLVSDDCPAPKECCFCTLMGGNPFPDQNFDLNLSFLEHGVLVELGSEKGKALLENAKGNYAPAEQKHLTQRDAQRNKSIQLLKEINKSFQFPLENLPSLIEDKYDSLAWKESCETCVSCCACTNICPSCHCFLLIENIGEKNRERLFNVVRSWDSCQSPGFARVAGGANPRKRLRNRFENRFLCKLQYKPRNYGIFACTGCGRCFEACQGKIDVRQVLSLVSK